jgi:Zinc knuckle
VSAEQLLAATIRATPKDYQAAITCEQHIRGTAVTLGDLESAMHQHWRSIKTNKKEKSEDDEELTLSAFDGKCFNCGKKGHKSPDCKERKKNGKVNQQGKKFDRKCNTCGKPGHMARTCWESEENAKLRPKGWKSNKGRTEVATVAVATVAAHNVAFLLGTIDGISVDETYDNLFNDSEFNLSSMTFPNTRALLNDPNVFIADTGLTVHSTRFKSGFKNAKQGTDEDAITMGNGSREGMAMIWDLPGTMCNKEGNELCSATLKDVAYLPTSQFNLFSIMTWVLHGDKDQISLTKGSSSVVFDIVISTPKGAIYMQYI